MADGYSKFESRDLWKQVSVFIIQPSDTRWEEIFSKLGIQFEVLIAACLGDC